MKPFGQAKIYGLSAGNAESPFLMGWKDSNLHFRGGHGGNKVGEKDVEGDFYGFYNDGMGKKGGIALKRITLMLLVISLSLVYLFAGCIDCLAAETSFENKRKVRVAGSQPEEEEEAGAVEEAEEAQETEEAETWAEKAACTMASTSP